MTLSNNEEGRLIKLLAEKSYSLGFDLFGVTASNSHPDIDYYKKWIKNKYHAKMSYLEKHTKLKSNPEMLLYGVKSILSFAASYNTNVPYSINEKRPFEKPRVSRYALNYDYHDVLAKKLKKLMSEVQSETKFNFKYRICVDSAPILERSYAVASGLGWIGKNGSLVNKKLGSFFFLAEVLTDIEIRTENYPMKQNTTLAKNYCGKCQRCIDACPTGAIVSEKIIDSSRCLSYLTIENKETISKEYKNKTNGFIFGCDICQEVCPYNKITPITRIKEFLPRQEIVNLEWNQCRNLTEEVFRKIFRKNPVKRTKYKGLMRNINLHF